MTKAKKVVAIIQARMGSTRLPGKSLMLLGDKPAVAHVIERVKQIPLIDEIWLATTDSSEDDPLFKWAKDNKVNVFRGSENDVLDRYYQTAKKAKADAIVRVTGDCPVLDPAVSGEVVKEFLKGGVDYVTNTKPPTYPDGLDTEVFSFGALQRAWREAKLPSEREHVTPYIWKNSKIFKVKNVSGKEDLSKFRLTLDTKEDLELLEKIISACRAAGKQGNLSDIEELFKQHPDWLTINAKYDRDEGYAKSVKKDSSLE